jgi:hypothetical protein
MEPAVNPIATTLTATEIRVGMRLIQVDAENELHVREVGRISADTYGLAIWFVDGDPKLRRAHARIKNSDTVVVFNG